MALWPAKHIDVAAMARSLHASWATDHAVVASAPATCPYLGDLSDHAGGMVLLGLTQQRLAVACSPRSDQQMQVRVVQLGAEGEQTSEQTYSAQIAEFRDLHNDQKLTFDQDNPAQRLAVVLLTLMHRQLISRETPGMDVTVVSAITPDAGLGLHEACDVAFALTLTDEPEEHQLGPMRTKLADVCAQASSTFCKHAPGRARYIAALRGKGEVVNVVDFADHSITHINAPDGFGFATRIVTAPKVQSSPDLSAMQRFIDDVTGAFAAPSLRQLPNARERVLAWLRAVHQVHPKSQAPSVDQASRWLRYLEHEIDRTLRAAASIRSRRSGDIVPAMNDSHQEYLSQLLDNEQLSAVAQLCLQYGAHAARAVESGVVCLVPIDRAEAFSQEIADAGLELVSVAPGETAELH
ncbi:hypothetical protein [Corynebacterium gerontici]|uniref:Galactokinase n=1 Tax=Corynebacterium gerontici TaxID=2079234 RepID=A0A3G6J1J0_9CORY|nr:hypothetical protein [Corynebacterium gerontici]AZA11842.1 hypothetical protein CGERO_07710 [Corynebacterium gerontici]